MNHWLERGKLKHLMKKYPVGCRIEARCSSLTGRITIYEGVVKGHEMLNDLNERKAYVVIGTSEFMDSYVREKNITRILQGAEKGDE